MECILKRVSMYNTIIYYLCIYTTNFVPLFLAIFQESKDLLHYILLKCLLQDRI